MAVSRLGEICARMQAAGRDGECPAVAVENASMTGQRVIKGTLASLPQRAADAGLGSPALLIIGESAAMAVESPETGAGKAADGLWSRPAPVG
jgi:siroheme synthase